MNGIINSIPGCLYWKDLNGRYLGCNNLTAELAGLVSPSEVIGKTDVELWGKQSDTLTQNDRKVLATGETLLIEEELQTADGRWLYFTGVKMPLRDENDTIIGIIGNSLDITDRKRMEENLRQAKEAAEAADKAKTEFLENMRHDIRTPLSGIIGCTTLIGENIDNPQKIGEVREYVDNVLASSNTLLTVLNSVLYAVKVSSGEMPLQKRKFDLKKELYKIMNLNQAKADQKNLKLTLEYDKSIPPYLVGDNERIFYIVLELVANALKFTSEGFVKIRAKLAKEKGRAVVIKIVVEDSGTGIPSDKKNEIFTRFKRLTPSYKGLYRGLGLGLSNIKQFIDDLEGEIYLESMPEREKGTAFTCIIQLAKALLNESFGVNEISIQSHEAEFILSPIIVSPEEGQQKTIKLTHILVVEDQPLAAKLAKSLLNGMNCSVDIAENGESAIINVKTNSYDLIFMDVGLPDISGNEVTKQIREWESLLGNRHTPIIALTAHVEAEDKQDCIKAGMDAVLSKPLTRETTLDILNAFIPTQQKL